MIGWPRARDRHGKSCHRSDDGSRRGSRPIFEYAKSAFKFAALFVVRNEIATGDRSWPRSTNGARRAPSVQVGGPRASLESAAGAPRVRRVSPDERGQRPLRHARTRPPSPLVAPVVVRGRVVAILLADGADADITRRAADARRGPLEVAKEDLTLVTGYAGDALEKHILRRKEQGLDTAGIESNPALPSSPDAPPSTPRVSAAPRHRFDLRHVLPSRRSRVDRIRCATPPCSAPSRPSALSASS